MNRKGQEIAITLFVLMVFVIFAYTLFTFYMNSDKISEKVYDASFIGEGIASERAVQTEIALTGYDRAVEKYNSASLTKQSLEERKSKFVSEFNGEIDIPDLEVKEKRVVFNVSGNNITMALLAENVFSSKKQILGEAGQSWALGLFDFMKPSSTILEAALGFYYPNNAKVILRLDEIGLNDLDYINRVLKDCKSSDNMQVCISERLPNFEVSIEYNSGVKGISLSTKRAFYINGELKRIKLEQELA